MADLPNPGVYNIFSTAFEDAAVVILPNQDAVRGIPQMPTMLTLTYVNRGNGICMISDTLQGRFLGINQLPDVEMTGAVYLSGEEQTWILRRVGDNYTISQEERFWFLAGLGEMIRTSPEKQQTWKFEQMG
ncbi:hypothetical protein AZE42_04232 [Rhizopogon vesiculosus]|uniref:Uncharacterized protein n=1 Tax=Rhizopogon vesiculosus TaxID=180088 RepID=A0A1J8R0W5_9AGAM|nr:hypothetical protein AZE42_04232 [Rhizopogon vesiculosus]